MNRIRKVEAKDRSNRHYWGAGPMTATGPVFQGTPRRRRLEWK